MSASGLSDEQVATFVRDGAIPVRGAFPATVADQCRAILWRTSGCDEHDPSTWTKPVIRIDGRADAPFVAAANTARLHRAFDQLAGPGRWLPPHGLGTFPIRFPSPHDPGDTGWHIEATGADGDGRPTVDPASRSRVLLMLFLFSEVGLDDAPTRIRLGSHRCAARRLAIGHGAPLDFMDLCRELATETAGLPESYATGQPGDVWLCHPFLVHAAQRHRGTGVRFMAQPPLAGTGPIDAHRPASDRSSVEDAIADTTAGELPLDA